MALSKRGVGVVVVIFAIAALGAGEYLRISSHGVSEVGGSGEDGAPVTAAASTFSTDVAIAVEGAPVQRGTLVLWVTASGQAEAWRRAVVTAEVAGRVDRVSVRESDRVGGGSVLVALAVVDKQLALDEARAALREAEGQYREQLLFDGDLAADVRREREAAARLKSGLDRAEIQLRRAELDLERTRIRAPFAGRVASIEVLPGQLVGQGAELMTVVDLDPIKVQVQVLEGELPHLEPGGAAEIRFSAFPEEAFAATIETINPLVDEQTRTARVTALVPNPGGRILPGMYVRVKLEAQRLTERVLVPREAILERDRRTMLFVHEDGRAKWRYVTTGLENEEYVEIVESPETDMLSPGETVLTGGHFTLTHDARVRLVEDRRVEGGRPQ